MIGLVEDELGHAAREALAGLLDSHHDLSRVRDMRGDPTGYEGDAWKRLATEGWLGARVAEELGGTALTATAAAAIPDLFGERLVPEPYVALGLLPSLALGRMEANCTRNAALADLLTGARTFALAWQEAPGQIDPDALCATKVSGVEGGRTVTGVKRFVAAGAAADAFLVPAKLGDEIVTLLVKAESDGVSLLPVRQIDGSMSVDVDLRGVRISEDAVVARDTSAIVAALEEGRVALAAQLLGIARQALRITIEYARTRRQFGQAIGSFQALQHRMVDLATRIRLGEVACDAALAALDAPSADGREIARLAAGAKASAAGAAVAVTQGAVQIHGAIGYTDEADIGLYLAAALRLAQWLGAPAVLRNRFLELGGASQHA